MIRKVLLFMLTLVLLMVGLQSSAQAGSAQNRQLAAVQQQANTLKRQIHKSESVINFYNHRGRWALHAPGTKHGKAKCRQVAGQQRRHVCRKARNTLALHTVRLHRLERKLQSILPWSKDLVASYNYRQCVIDYESRDAGLYTAENGGTPGVESSSNSDASGAYQFLDSTWRARFAAAKEYYGSLLSGSWTHAAYAPAWVQDVVAAFSTVFHTLRGNDWTHSQCDKYKPV